MSLIVSASESWKSPNQYIVDVINEKKSTPVGIMDYRLKPLIKSIREWGGEQLDGVFLSGSTMKGTSLKGSSDVDLFISLKANTRETLREIYILLFKHLSDDGYNIEKRNVAQRIIYWGLQIDIVPGKKLPDKTHWHYLHTNRWTDTDRIQTNVHQHIQTVLDSRRVNEILALKIWKQLNKLEFPSIYLEQYVIKSLYRKWSGKAYLADNFICVLDDIAHYFLGTAIYDPCNRSNVISDTIYKYQKEEIRDAAIRSLNKNYLNQIIR